MVKAIFRKVADAAKREIATLQRERRRNRLWMVIVIEDKFFLLNAAYFRQTLKGEIDQVFLREEKNPVLSGKRLANEVFGKDKGHVAYLGEYGLEGAVAYAKARVCLLLWSSNTAFPSEVEHYLSDLACSEKPVCKRVFTDALQFYQGSDIGVYHRLVSEGMLK